MANTFYFYDLETTGFNPKEARIMQFGGQRTDMNLKPVGEPHDFLIRLSGDVLPEPDAILVTGITPQQTLSDGLSEAEFLKIFHEEVSVPGTIFVGFNSIRFDDEFMRYLNYRNFYDPYEWQWRDDRSRWDLMDVVRMMRALRPEGIKWPFGPTGSPSNRLEHLTSVNDIKHEAAHTALADVKALIELAKLAKTKQPKLFDYLLNLRDKKKVAMLVNSGQPFVYTSGRYSSDYEKTAIVGNIGDSPNNQGVLVYDLRIDCRTFANLDTKQITAALSWQKGTEGPKLPVKVLRPNRAPAIAPLSVLTDENLARLELDPKIAAENYQRLMQSDLPAKIIEALRGQEKLLQARFLEDAEDVDKRLYEGFFSDSDKQAMRSIQEATADDLKSLRPKFNDARLSALLPLYKARNYPNSMNDEDRKIWESFRERKLFSGKNDSLVAKFFKRIEELMAQPELSDNQRYILEELKLYGESILPSEPA